MADNWVLLYNGEKAVQDVAGGSRETFSVRDPKNFALFTAIAGTSYRDIQLSAETYELIDQIVRIGNAAVAKAQEESRRMGVPNVYSINGRIYFETRTGALSATDPYTNGREATGQTDEREPE